MHAGSADLMHCIIHLLNPIPSRMSLEGLDISEGDPYQAFEFTVKVGEGSYGAVYKAIDKSDGMVVAVKVLDVR